MIVSPLLRTVALAREEKVVYLFGLAHYLVKTPSLSISHSLFITKKEFTQELIRFSYLLIILKYIFTIPVCQNQCLCSVKRKNR